MSQTQRGVDSVTDGRRAEVEERQLVCFRLADEEFGVDIKTVREIVRVPEITYIPRAPQYVSGIANLRGNVLPVIDGRRRLFLPEAEATERTRVLILDVQGTTTGMVVDAVSEVKRVATSDEEPPPSVIQSGVDQSFLSGVIKLDGGKRLIMVIRPEEIVNIDTSVAAARKETLYHNQKTEESQTKKQDELVERQLVSFVVGEEEYAFDIGVVKEILRLTEITAVPNAPHYVRGLFTVRNVLLPLLDLRIILGMPEMEASDQRVLVIEVEGLTLGLMVDKVNEVLRVPMAVIDQTPRLASSGRELQAVARLDDGKRLILILDQRGLIDVEEVGAIMGDDQTGSTVSSKTGISIEEEQLVTFLLGGEEYGIEITQVQEINRLGEITRLPKAPAFLAGVTNLRGQVVPLVNLRRRFSLPDQEADDRTRIIIVELDGARTGIIVDQVNEVLRLSAKDIEPTPQIVSSGRDEDQGEFMSGVCKANEGNRMILLLDTGKLFSSKEQKEIRSTGVKRDDKKKPAKGKRDLEIED
ncbi:MAG: chemotaxis protein CheW [Deltaproteobacteria bacterium]|nr:chemotaxis protein CheW [Deltaproteobacteria bacterium]